MNVEVCQDQIGRKYGTAFHMPVDYYSTFMCVAYGKTAKEATLEGHIIPAEKLQEIAAKQFARGECDPKTPPCGVFFMIHGIVFALSAAHCVGHIGVFAE